MSRHKCNYEIYKAFLQASSVRYSGLALSEVCPEPLSHDSVSRWLKSRNYRPSQVWEIAKEYVKLSDPCILIADDTVLDKHRSEKISLVNYQYSGNTHNVIAGIGLVNLLWHGQSTVPIDYRVYDKDTDGKTKNDHFREMLRLAKARGITPNAVVMDAWYSSLDNLKAIRDLGWVFVSGLKKNRKVNRNEELQNLTFPDEGLKLHLRGFGMVTVFRFVAKNGRTDYIGTNICNPTKDQIESIVKARWAVEVYHRELKQTCGIESCMSRSGRAQRNHIFMAISAWFEKHKIRYYQHLTLYQQQWDVLKEAITYKMTCLLI